nr:Porin ompk36 [Klebsiella pneumoniae]
MKRKVLALVIPALLAAGAAHAAEIYNKDGNKLDLYGKVDGLHYFSSDSKKDGDQTYLRFGFKGETQINDMLTGYGQWEYNVQANNTETSSDQAWTRLAFAGIKVGDYGSFDYGRNYGVLYDVEGWTDMLPEFGGDSYTYADNFMAGRANGVATYRNSDFFGLVEGLNFALQYQGKTKARTRRISTSAPITAAATAMFASTMAMVSASPLPTTSAWASARRQLTPRLTVQATSNTILTPNDTPKATKRTPGPPA